MTKAIFCNTLAIKELRTYFSSGNTAQTPQRIIRLRIIFKKSPFVVSIKAVQKNAGGWRGVLDGASLFCNKCHIHCSPVLGDFFWRRSSALPNAISTTPSPQRHLHNAISTTPSPQRHLHNALPSQNPTAKTQNDFMINRTSTPKTDPRGWSQKSTPSPDQKQALSIKSRAVE